MEKGFIEALITLRRKIRQSGKQVRQQNDNSKSLFHPEKGFTHAYEIAPVEAALDEFEKSIAGMTDADARPSHLSPEEALMAEAQMLAEVHPSKDTRMFAHAVIKYLLDQEKNTTSGQVLLFAGTGSTEATDTH